jgi:hypothetical protein
LSGAAGAAPAAPLKTRINAEYTWLIRAGISALEYGVVANVGGYDVGGQLNTTGLVGVISHVGPNASRGR